MNTAIYKKCVKNRASAPSSDYYLTVKNHGYLSHDLQTCASESGKHRSERQQRSRDKEDQAGATHPCSNLLKKVTIRIIRITLARHALRSTRFVITEFCWKLAPVHLINVANKHFISSKRKNQHEHGKQLAIYHFQHMQDGQLMKQLARLSGQTRICIMQHMANKIHYIHRGYIKIHNNSGHTRQTADTNIKRYPGAWLETIFQKFLTYGYCLVQFFDSLDRKTTPNPEKPYFDPMIFLTCINPKERSFIFYSRY